MGILKPIHNPTGGGRWHWQAWRQRHQWSATLAQMSSWWAQSSPAGDTLVLIGASAGWMMSFDWLTQFKTIETWDIDPWAPRLFEWRHGGRLRQKSITLVHHQGDFWVHAHIDKRKASTVYWFDNVLGQLRFLHSPEVTRQRISAIPHLLQGLAWGSVHDRYSGPRLPNPNPTLESWPSLSGVDLLDEQAQRWLHGWGAQDAWLDHMTQDVFPKSTPVLNLGWLYQPHFGHWLEMGWGSMGVPSTPMDRPSHP